MNDLVSIITPSYNSESFICQTIEAIINQNYKNWELLITDDCSEDGTVRVIEDYARKDERIKLFKLEKNSGAGVARNNSIKNAHGRFLAFCDSDDRWTPDKLEKQLRFMLDNGYEMTYTSYRVCDEDGNVISCVNCRRKVSYLHEVLDDAMGFLTVVCDTERMGKLLMPTIRKRQDWAFKLRALSKCRVAYGLQEPLAIYRTRRNSISSNKFALIKYNYAIYRYELQYGRITSALILFLLFIPYNIGKKIKQRIARIG